MKKSLLRMALAAIIMCLAPMQANAQITDILKNVTNAVTSSKGETAINAITNLLGTKKVSEKSLVGTWAYSDPCVAFESENVLASLGSSVASSKVENTLSKQLTRLGFTSGKVVMTLNEDKSATIAYAGKNVPCTWEIEGTNLILKFLNKSVKMNVKMEGTKLQVAMSADRLLTLVTAITDKASTVNSTLGTVNSLVKNVKGMNLGLKFTKK